MISAVKVQILTLSVVKAFSFNVTITDDPAPVKPVSGSGKDVSASTGKSVEAAIEYLYTAADFNFDLWNKNAPTDETKYAVGKKLLPQKQLNLLQALE